MAAVIVFPRPVPSPDFRRQVGSEIELPEVDDFHENSVAVARFFREKEMIVLQNFNQSEFTCSGKNFTYYFCAENSKKEKLTVNNIISNQFCFPVSRITSTSGESKGLFTLSIYKGVKNKDELEEWREGIRGPLMEQLRHIAPLVDIVRSYCLAQSKFLI